MSIADKISRLSAARAAISSAVSAKGGSVPSGAGFEELASAVGTIPTGGITPSGATNITSNGTYDVAAFATAVVSVTGSSTPLATGTVTIATAGNVTVTGLTFEPTVVILYPKSTVSEQPRTISALVGVLLNGGYFDNITYLTEIPKGVYAFTPSSGTTLSLSAMSASNTGITSGSGGTWSATFTSSSARRYQAGIEFEWVAYGRSSS